MACVNPLDAHKAKGRFRVGRPMQDAWDETFRIPCGRCLGCIKDRARHWAYRCHLEAREHAHTTFVTLTYDDINLPLTLNKSHLSSYLKRIRKHLDHPIKFFGCGEYGDRFGRPHYHALLFGVDHQRQLPLLESAWHTGGKHGRLLGNILAKKCTPRAISYVAGYSTGKLREHGPQPTEVVDGDTGEVVPYQPPFRLMSRRPGIGAKARDEFPDAWRTHVVTDGVTASVPRYLHQRWKDNASPEEEARRLEELKARFGTERISRTMLAARNRELQQRDEHYRLQRAKA